MADQESKKPEGTEKPKAANLYHKEAPVPRSRMRDDSAGKPPLLSIQIGGKPHKRRPTRSNPFQQVFKSNLKRLLMVGGLMTLLIIIALQIVSNLGAMRDRKNNPIPGPLRVSVNGTLEPVTTGKVLTGRTLTTPVQRAGTNNSIAPNTSRIDTEALRKAAYIAKKAKSFEDAGDLDKAIQNYREALEVWPYQPAIWAQLGRCYLKQKDYWHSQVALEKAVEGRPDAADVLNDLGVAYLWQDGKLNEAMRMFQTASDVDPTYAPIYFNKALAFLAKNDSAKAREALDQFLRMKPEDPRGLRERACMRAKEGHREEALEELERAISQAPEWPLLYFDAAAITALLGQFDTSIRYLEKAEPLAGPASVYKLYQEPAFATLRLSELGKVFEKKLADDARELLNQKEAPLPTTSEPILSNPRTDR